MPNPSRNPLGRPRGLQNKIPRDIKRMIFGALHDLGGKRYLIKLGREQPAVFVSLLSKIIPREDRISIDGAGTIVVVSGIEAGPGQAITLDGETVKLPPPREYRIPLSLPGDDGLIGMGEEEEGEPLDADSEPDA